MASRQPPQPGDRSSPEPVSGLRYAFALLLDWTLHRRSRVRCAGCERYRPDRPALIVSNHRRDTDGPLVASMLLARRGLRMPGPLPHFVAREDLLRRGFLRRYLISWPGWVRTLLGPLSLAPFLRFMNVHPMRRFPEQTLGEVLEEVRTAFADPPLEEVLRPDWLQRFRALGPGESGPFRVSEALARRYRPLLEAPFGLRRLTLARLRELKPLERRTVRAQLREVLDQLERGRPVHFVPEGRVSPHGGPQRLREGTYRLLADARGDTAVLPLGIVHDDLNAGKPRVLMAMGEEIRGWRGAGRSRAERMIRDAIRAQLTLGLSQVASARVLACAADGLAFSAAGLDAHVAAEAERFRDLGAPVDPLLLDGPRRFRRLEGFLRFCLRHGLVAAEGDGYRPLPERVEKADPWRPQGLLRYAANELDDMARYWRHPAFRSRVPVAQALGA